MKTLLTIIALTIFFRLDAQQTWIELRNGNSVKTTITGKSPEHIVTNDGAFQLKDISKIHLKEQGFSDIDKQFYESLRNSGVAIYFDFIEDSSPLLKANEVTVLSMEKFRQQTTTAKALQLVGALALGVAITMNALADDQYQEDIKSGAAFRAGYDSPLWAPTWLPPAAFGIMGAGFAIDLGARKHLRSK